MYSEKLSGLWVQQGMDHRHITRLFLPFEPSMQAYTGAGTISTSVTLHATKSGKEVEKAYHTKPSQAYGLRDFA